MNVTAHRSIRRLEPATASRIAAGEVIERPLSALKELIENALDAGARHVEVRSGKTLDEVFQVADDGVGIAAGEIELALERHATSKIQSLDDLHTLTTLGFRGEALPSIAAVSRMKIATRTRESESAMSIEVEGGEVRARAETARAPGTTVEVRDLFFNLPARRKFLNSPAGELRAALRLMEAMALAYPETAFRMVVDDRQRFDWPAAASRRDRAAALWGARHAEQLIEATGEREGFVIEALLGLPEHARSTREGQIFLINRRWVQAPMLSSALRQAYGDLLPGGRFPSAALWLTVPADRLDVNVHPTKREVRFAQEAPVFSLVAAACSAPLAGLHPPFTVVRGGAPAEPKWADRVREQGQSSAQLGIGRLFDRAETAATDAPVSDPSRSAQTPEAAATAPDTTTDSETEFWQLHRTYILAPVRGGLIIVDQHAAHERILYEEALARMAGGRGSSQQLLFPALVDLSRDQFELLLELGPWLGQLGWDLSPMGPPTVVIQGIPAGLRHDHPGQLLQDLLDGLGEASGRAADADISERLARSYACHAATRAGDKLSQVEMRTLVDRLFATSRPHGDPHGRATFVRLELEDLHRRFGRS
jgi:DNA mismatch repair protein MutL